MLDDIRNMKGSFLLKEICRKLLNIFKTLLERETNEHRKRMMAKMDRPKYNCLYLLARPKGDNFSQGQCAFDNARGSTKEAVYRLWNSRLGVANKKPWPEFRSKIYGPLSRGEFTRQGTSGSLKTKRNWCKEL